MVERAGASEGEDDGLVSVTPVLSRVPDFAGLLAQPGDVARLRADHLGNAEFIAGLERILGRPLAKRAPGRKPNAPNDRQG